jgi:hypothetical protein
LLEGRVRAQTDRKKRDDADAPVFEPIVPLASLSSPEQRCKKHRHEIIRVPSVPERWERVSKGSVSLFVCAIDRNERNLASRTSSARQRSITKDARLAVHRTGWLFAVCRKVLPLRDSPPETSMPAKRRDTQRAARLRVSVTPWARSKSRQKLGTM